VSSTNVIITEIEGLQPEEVIITVSIPSLHGKFSQVFMKYYYTNLISVSTLLITQLTNISVMQQLRYILDVLFHI